jgi:transcriptional regulator with XRE-family HTH domain
MEFTKAECTRIGGTIASIRKKVIGKSQKAVATCCNFNRSYLSRIELGQQAPTLAELNRIADVLEVSLSYLLGGIDSDEKLKWIEDLAELSPEEWMRIGINARLARVNLGLSQQQVAQKTETLDISQRDIGGLEKGEFRRAVQRNFPAIAISLNTTPEELLNGQPPEIGRPGSGPIIEMMRDERGLTQGQLAAMAGISCSTLSRIEKNKRGATGAEWFAIKSALGVESYPVERYECIPDEDVPVDNPVESFGAAVFRARTKLGFSPCDLAGLALIHENQVTEAENGDERNLPWFTKIRIAEVLGLTIEAIPHGLKDFAVAEGLIDEQVQMLSKIHWMGVQPTDTTGWKFLYKAIKIAIAE